MDNVNVIRAFNHLGARPIPIEIGLLDGLSEIQIRALQSIMKSLRHVEECRVTIDESPIFDDSHGLEYGTLHAEKFRDSATRRGSVDLAYAHSSQRPRQLL